MHYRKGMSATDKVGYLENLLLVGDSLADVLSLASIKSKEEVASLSQAASRSLADVARVDAIPILKGIKGYVPIVGRSPTEELEDAIVELDAFFVPEHEAELEMDLAVIYNALMYSTGADALRQSRNELITRAHGKIDSKLGVMFFHQRSGAIRYMDAAFYIAKGYKRDIVVENHLNLTTEILTSAQETAITPYHLYMASFNLGRVQSLRLQQERALREFNRAYIYADQIGNGALMSLAEHYFMASGNSCLLGTVIDDPVEFKDVLQKLVQTVSVDERKIIRV